MSNNDEHSSISEKLVAAYDNVIYKIYDTIDNSEESEKPHSLHQLIDKAIERTVEFGEITSEEAQKVSDYLKRDITEISNYIAEDEENELKSWFKFDLQQIEDRFIEALNSIADPTKLELNKLSLQAADASIYKTGEICSPGSLTCQHCGKILHFTKTSHIPPCPSCKKVNFVRE